jgi:AraC-like DNA-binding protein
MKFNISTVHREITPISSQDCFLVFDRVKDDFDFPIHFHPEYEINFIINCAGVERYVGDSVEEIDDIELVLVGSNVFHGWKLNTCTNKNIHEITIQFHNDLLDQHLLSRTIMHPIREMFERSSKGIVFSKETAEILKPRLLKLLSLSKTNSFFELFSILNEMAISPNQRLLSSNSIHKNTDNFYNSEKIKLVYNYIRDNFETKIKVKDIAAVVNMTEVSFSRFIKKRTGKTFVEYLNDLRIGYAARWLIEDNLSISEIAYKSGFNNFSNFNRNFKNNRGCTPTEYRKNFEGIKRFL